MYVRGRRGDGKLRGPRVINLIMYAKFNSLSLKCSLNINRPDVKRRRIIVGPARGGQLSGQILFHRKHVGHVYPANRHAQWQECHN